MRFTWDITKGAPIYPITNNPYSLLLTSKNPKTEGLYDVFMTNEITYGT